MALASIQDLVAQLDVVHKVVVGNVPVFHQTLEKPLKVERATVLVGVLGEGNVLLAD